MNITANATITLPVDSAPGCTVYTTAVISWLMPHSIMPTVRKTRRRPIREATALFIAIATTPNPVRMQLFSNALPTLAISKKYVP